MKGEINMKKTLIALLALLAISTSAFAQPTIFDKENKSKAFIQEIITKTENYYKTPMPNTNIYVTYNDNEFYKRLRKMGFKKETASLLTKTSQGVTSAYGIEVAINMKAEGQMNDLMDFIIAHEFVHVYQLYTYSYDVIKNKALMEGQADLIAGKICDCKVGAKDYNIPLSKINDTNNWHKIDEKRAIHQARYYVKYLWDKGQDIDSPLVASFN